MKNIMKGTINVPKIPGMGFEPMKLTHDILSVTPLTARETWLKYRNRTL